MASTRKKSNTADQTFGGVSDLVFVEKPPEKDLSEALFSTMDQAKAIDTFEQAIGISVKKEDTKPRAYIKSTTLDLDKEKDRKLLEALMNDPRYKIMSWDKNWSNLGRLRAFVIYSDNQVEDNKKTQ